MKQISRIASWLALSISVLCVTSQCWATVEPELTTAVRRQNVQRVQTLLSEGANINERDDGPERTPLMWAAVGGNVTIVQGLLNHGAVVNAKDDFGKTALMLAIENGHNRIARLLLDKGAKASVQRSGRAMNLSAVKQRHVTLR